MTTLDLRPFDIAEVTWREHEAELAGLRRLVFIEEQQVPAELEWDGEDDAAWHWLATDSNGRALGTSRLLPSGQVGRMAVLRESRGTGIGAALLEMAVRKAAWLGMNEVFLHAQTHALGFYERAGFKADGSDPFDEAGIPHQRMSCALNLPDTPAQAITATPQPPLLAAIKDYDCAEASWARAGRLIRSIRADVLVRELGLTDRVTDDEQDSEQMHWTATMEDGQVVGVLRMSATGQLSRLAVLRGFRRKGIGISLVEQALIKARRFGLKTVYTSTLTASAAFWEKHEFVTSAPVSSASGAQPSDAARTITLERAISTADVHNQERPAAAERASIGDDYDDSSLAHQLGKTNRLVLLRREDEFRETIQRLAEQATQSVLIHSPLLDHKLFNTTSLATALSALARRNRYTRVEILVYDSHRMVKHGHRLLELARKLSSSITIRIAHPDYRHLNHEYVLADGAGVVYRIDHELFEGFANYHDYVEVNRLSREFRRSWEAGLYDPNLRQLQI